MNGWDQILGEKGERSLYYLSQVSVLILNCYAQTCKHGSRNPSLKLCEEGSLYGILVMLRAGEFLRVRANVAQSTAKVALDHWVRFFITFMCTTSIAIL